MSEHRLSVECAQLWHPVLLTVRLGTLPDGDQLPARPVPALEHNQRRARYREFGQWHGNVKPTQRPAIHPDSRRGYQ